MKAQRVILVTLWLSSLTKQSLQACREAYKKPGPTHTACLPPNPDCTIESRRVSMAEQRVILVTHNAYRSMVAMGKLRYFPEATNMQQLFWDEELASVAQALADQCTPDSGKLIHDEPGARFTTKFNFTGQNLAFRASSAPFKGPDWLGPIKAWFNEYPHYPPSRLGNFSSRSGDPTGHFTQLVWATTRYLGCGYVSYTVVGYSRLPYMQLYVCNYADAGNVYTFPVYDAGDMCSACPEGTTCVKETGLCSSLQDGRQSGTKAELPEARRDERNNHYASTQKSTAPGNDQPFWSAATRV
ncbi:CRISP/Allergen/PR-1 [Rhipicephalus microplus]|uniref:CRISP/Allergen/PR-1 n=1 Tax=Rhipicephalus microplus TaxID=6941 RepID=UPI001888CD52|nr:CRISP/Allergen/PR-1-like [Rhipicephalus microplus]